jgi:hypothetical protein
MRTGLAGAVAALACVLWLTGAIASSLPDADVISPALVRAANPDPTDEDSPSERSDCAVRDAVCHAGCLAQRDLAGCVSERCEPLLRQCLAAVPAGRARLLPAACIGQDQAAVQLIEWHGEMLDLDDDALAQAYATLIRARIACVAGRLAEALALYDAILGSLRVAVSSGYQGPLQMRDASLTRRAARTRTAAMPQSRPDRD